MIPKILLSVLCFVGLLSNLALTAGNSLGIEKDLSIVKYGLHSWGSVCHFDATPDNATFLTMVDQAFKDMVKKAGRKKIPTVMIGLSIGKEVYFSSSVKGWSPIVYKLFSWNGGKGDYNEYMLGRFGEVIDALDACAHAGQMQHKNNGMCGEITSVLSWMIDHPGKSPKGWNPEIAPKVACFNRLGYCEPCATGEKTIWGCAQWTEKMGLRVVKDIHDRPNTFPSPKKVSYVSLGKYISSDPSKGKHGDCASDEDI